MTWAPHAHTYKWLSTYSRKINNNISVFFSLHLTLTVRLHFIAKAEKPITSQKHCYRCAVTLFAPTAATHAPTLSVFLMSLATNYTIYSICVCAFLCVYLLVLISSAFPPFITVVAAQYLCNQKCMRATSVHSSDPIAANWLDRKLNPSLLN